MRPLLSALWLAGAVWMAAAASGVSADPLAVTNAPPLNNALPDVGGSVVRVFGAMGLVIALFLGGTWLFRNWQRLTNQRTGPTRLRILEIKPMGPRHALYVVSYQQQRMLLASSPAGVVLVSHLPEMAEAEVETASPPPPAFALALQRILGRKP